MSARATSETFLALETIAGCYGVEVRLIRTLYARGLFGPGEPRGEDVALPTRRLDRVAEVLRLHVHVGVDLTTLELLLRDPEP